MKVLWLTNIILPQIASELGREAPAVGGWMTSTLEYLVEKDNVELVICFPVNRGTIISGSTSNVKFYGFPSKKPAHVRDKQIIDSLQFIVNESKPDLIHIWGTEYFHSYAMALLPFSKKKTIVGIQGLCGVIANHYFAGLPERIIRRNTFRDLVRADSIKKQKAKFLRRGEFENKTLQNANAIIGRTTWDKACAKRIAPNVKYYTCNETLRSEFFMHQGQWNLQKCEKHSMFVSQANYPIKGFHQVIDALPYILKKYPDAKLYVTGKNPFETKKWKLSSYQKYLCELILKKGLFGKVIFLGKLDAEQMCQQYLKSNVFVSASSIENSPNSVGEAMLLGVPIVASYVGGTMDMLRDKQEGYLYQFDAPYMLAHYVCSIFADEHKAYSMGQQASKHAQETHNPQANVGRLLEIYTEVYEQ